MSLSSFLPLVASVRQATRIAEKRIPSLYSSIFIQNSLYSTDAKQSQPKKDDLANILVNVKCSELTANHIGNYYKSEIKIVPEGFPDFHQAFLAKAGPGEEKKGGQRSVQHEFHFSGHNNILFRSSMLELFDIVKEGKNNRILLSGSTGSGKSFALFSLVEWARQQNWIVLYIPSAFSFTRGGFYYRRPETGKYDTLTSAHILLKSLLDCHRPQLAKLPHSTDPKKTLLDIVQQGLVNDDAKNAVDSCLEVIHELTKASESTPVLFAIDGYNALYSLTDYGVPIDIHLGTRRVLMPNELTLANELRLLERTDVGKARVVVSPSWVKRTEAPVGNPINTTEFAIPRYDFNETASSLYYYQCCGLAPEVPTEKQVKMMQHITNGNAHEIRELAIKMSMLKLNRL